MPIIVPLVLFEKVEASKAGRSNSNMIIGAKTKTKFEPLMGTSDYNQRALQEMCLLGIKKPRTRRGLELLVSP